MNRKYRNTVIAANWKMNMLPSKIKAYAEELKPLAAPAKWCDIVICPPFVMIPAAQKAFRDSRISIGAQNLNENESGAYTGEVSSEQLSDLGAHYVIIGHSERRQLFGETDITVNKKVHAALQANLRPIVCVGETAQQREMNVTEELVTLQLKAALAGVPATKMRRIVVAYEPIWAIGTGNTATAADAEAVAASIRAVIRGLYGARTARAISILYGGSMNAKNAFELLSQPDVDGGLIGGASLVPADFAAIINAANQDAI
ncbi:triosephosphate isomerase [Sporobacter termitidis DSM 10068]|uniref:Triosephosphate isomerase n=1 Tax=Sporobacter termitidis DSM 10068 TaxID=1123282 RepID=A0A1M5YVL0_9FIRM|nr:triose-phosphate isomerase [Sporobacter termitidis]SHI16035.1 triosephosphate isomerase [Sporobacter termitidis DSM 10068]